MIRFLLDNRQEVLALTGQHLMLVAVSTLIAAAVAIPLGIVAARRPRLSRWVLGFANMVQTIPSLALFGFLIPLPFLGGIGARTALVALVLYALLPMVRNTVAGIHGVDPAIREAALGLGLTPRQMLFMVELPLARNVIFAGLRTATVISVGVATIAAAIGAGGLGMLIFRGVSMVDNRLILAGAIPAALLAIVLDVLLGWLERSSNWKAPAALLGVLCVSVVISLWPGAQPRLVVGAKNFTEQLILAEILAQHLERRTGLEVERRVNLAGTLIAHQALIAGQLDLYPEYVGTALQAVLNQPGERDPAKALATVRAEYARRFDVEAGDSLGFENTFAILVRGETARKHGLKTISQAAPWTPQWKAGFGYEFLERDDGYAGLSRTYGLRFAAPPAVMDLSLTPRALAEGRVDLIAGNSTDGLIPALDLAMLEDDRRYFPPYQAVVLARREALQAHPGLAAALAELHGAISADTMRRLNAAVDLAKRHPKAVAAEFLAGLKSAAAVR